MIVDGKASQLQRRFDESLRFDWGRVAVFLIAAVGLFCGYCRGAFGFRAAMSHCQIDDGHGPCREISALNIKQLETFLAIVKSGSFAAAAERLNATPSTISARIHDLEQDLGAILFDRSQRKSPLTAKGRELTLHAERATAAFTEIRTRIGDGGAMSGLVRLGVQLIHVRYPKLVLELTISLTAELLHGVRSGSLDIALLPGLTFDPTLIAKNLGQVRFAWMAGRMIELADTLIRPEDLGDMRILSLGKDSFHYHTVDHWLKLQGNTTHRVDICNSMGVVSSLTQAGIGVSLLPLISYATEISRGDLRVLETSPAGPIVDFFALYERGAADHLPSLISDLAVEASSFESQ
jgi:DNA-binding transcriptional LysR family regulator